MQAGRYLSGGVGSHAVGLLTNDAGRRRVSGEGQRLQ